MARTPAQQPLGIVRGLWRYPVKSMAAEPLDTAEVSWNGLAGDRRWAFIRPDSAANGFPFQTIRENPDMCRYRAELVDLDRPWRSPVRVHTPDGQILPVTDPQLASEIGPGSRAAKLNRGQFDAMPLSLITTTTVRTLCEQAGVAVNPLRFRPNVLIEPYVDEPFVEDDWLGRDLTIDDVIVRMDRRDPRCVIVNVDPETAERTPGVLKGIGAERQACAGVYGSTVREGQVRVGRIISG